MSIILNVINYLWKLGFNEESPDLYVKDYGDSHRISVDVAREIIDYGTKIRVSDESLTRVSQRNLFVIEAVDRLLKRKYLAKDLHLGRSPSYDIAVEDESGRVFMAVRWMEWEEEYDARIVELKRDHSILRTFFDVNGDVEYFCAYTSWLKAGAIEYRYTVFPRTFSEQDSKTYTRGFLEERVKTYSPVFDPAWAEGSITTDDVKIIGDFEVSRGVLTKYVGSSPRVAIPEGVERLKNGVFWNCRTVEEILIPNTVRSLGGDTFCECVNLSELTIPESVSIIGDNPFLNCAKLNLKNRSPHFIFEDGGLYDKGKTRIIYCAIKRDSSVFEVPSGVISIAKHSFYNCRSLKRIIIPSSVKIMENNPFSNIPELRVENNSPHFIMRDGALYNKTMTTLFYFEHGTGSRDLAIPEGVRIIGRHSFFNCKTIRTITIPGSVEVIGYNPFAGCSSLTLINHSPEYMYQDGVLYDKTGSELIFYSMANEAEEFIVPTSVRKIGRSAFYGCLKLKKVVIPEGVLKIERYAFANCANLQEVSIPKSVTNVGDWAFMKSTNAGA